MTFVYMLQVKLSSLKREEDILHKEAERLEIEKQRYLRYKSAYFCRALLSCHLWLARHILKIRLAYTRRLSVHSKASCRGLRHQAFAVYGADAYCMNGRSFRLLKEEESGSYQCGMLLNQRYLIQRLLGRGGFSEVYQVTQPAIRSHVSIDKQCLARNLSYIS